MSTDSDRGEPMTLRDVVIGVSLFLLVCVLLAGGVALGIALIHWIERVF